MQNDDLKRFYPQGGDSSDNNDFVRYDENGKIPYVDGKFLEKQTGTTTNPQAYVKNADGTQGMLDVDTNASGGSIAQRKSDGRLNVVSPLYDNEATNKKYVDDGFVAKNTEQSGYTIRIYGTRLSGGEIIQAMLNATDGVYGGIVVMRDGNGQLSVPETPSADGKATSKKYVDTKCPDAPSEVGTYVLKAVVTESGTTYSWVAES